MTLQPTIMVDIVGVKNVAKAQGWRQSFLGLSSITAMPILGKEYLDMSGCICHFVKWQIHPFISKNVPVSNGFNIILFLTTYIKSLRNVLRYMHAKVSLRSKTYLRH